MIPNLSTTRTGIMKTGTPGFTPERNIPKKTKNAASGFL
jgi:hypothetical protein